MFQSKVLLRFAYSLPCDTYLAVIVEIWTFTRSINAQSSKEWWPSEKLQARISVVFLRSLWLEEMAEIPTRRWLLKLTHNSCHDNCTLPSNGIVTGLCTTREHPIGSKKECAYSSGYNTEVDGSSGNETWMKLKGKRETDTLTICSKIIFSAVSVKYLRSLVRPLKWLFTPVINPLRPHLNITGPS